MITALLLMLSTALIAAGVALIWRDVYRGDRHAFLVRSDRLPPAGADPELEVSVTYRAPNPAPVRPLAEALAARVDQFADAGRAPDTEAQWPGLQPVLDAAVEQVNAVLSVAGVAVGTAGEPMRSMGGGYGVYRRILIGGDSVGWLRLELDAGGQLQATVKAHKDNLAAINAGASVAAGDLDVARASDLLSECLKPAASFVMRTASGGSTEAWASATAWKELEPVVVAALQATNGALAQAGARFIPIGAPSWVPEARRHRLTVVVEVFNAEVARLLIEQAGEEIEIAVGLPDARLAHLGRRHRIPASGLTTHSLAELIASCSWPTVAHFREAS